MTYGINYYSCGTKLRQDNDLGITVPLHVHSVPHSPRGATGTRMLTSSAREESQSSWKLNIPPLHSYILFTENEDFSITDLM